MSTLIQNNKTFSLGNITGSHDKLPVGNYSLQHSDRDGYFLVQQEDFKIPSKLYGDFSFIDRWIKSYQNNSEKNLGILLSGIKGTGKTVAAQLFCNRIGYPTIFITSNYEGPEFEEFISDPKFENSIIFIDEFEKVYERESDTNSLLTLMDGMYRTKLIFVLTANDPSRINNKLQNRLNRIKYHKLYEKLEDEIIDEIIEDLLIHKEHKQSLLDFIVKFDFITMDVLTSVIKEINVFNEDAMVCASYLNLTEESSYYKVSVIHNGITYKCDGHNFNFRTQDLEICYVLDTPSEELVKILPDYTSVDINKLNYIVNKGIVTAKYTDDVTIVLKRGSYSLAF